jgi:hypothetical protein
MSGKSAPVCSTCSGAKGVMITFSFITIGNGTGA